MMMSTWGANCFPSPSDKTQAGRNILAQDPDSPGSLGIAISEAIEDAVSGKDSRYSLGSVLNHVLLHQTIIGLEAKKQFEKIGEVSRRGHRLRRRRKQLRRGEPSLRAGQDPRQTDFHYSLGADFLPDADERSLCLRLRRHGEDDAPSGHAHPRPRLHSRADPRGRAALPRDGAHREPPAE